MQFKITKIHEGILDTNIERQRISKAFKDDPETHQQLTELLDAVEEMDWKKAYQLLSSEWWKGRDEKQECYRLEFIGFLKLKDLYRPNNFAIGFDHCGDYSDLILAMVEQEESGYRVNVEPLKESIKKL